MGTMPISIDRGGAACLINNARIVLYAFQLGMGYSRWGFPDRRPPSGSNSAGVAIPNIGGAFETWE